MKLPPDLLVEFARERVEHAILGGHAFAFHAEPRATKELDLLIGGSAEICLAPPGHWNGSVLLPASSRL